MKLKVFIESLGCSKNLVDSEVMMGLLDENGFVLTKDAYESDVIIVNTCGFIDAAKQESIDTIVELGTLKKQGNCKSLIVCGCLAERYADELLKELPEVDAVVGTGDYPKIIDILSEVFKGKRIKESGHIDAEMEENLPRTLSTPSYIGYLKISEGCDNHCTYCIIPKLRGSYRSRKMESILKEAHHMAERGIREIVLIAQDTSRYGIDLYKEYKLSELLENLCKIDGIKWIRVLYCYPDKISDELIEVIAREEKICKYLDIPIQHCSDTILKKMNRKTSKKEIVQVVQKLREKVPNMHIRTTLIVGFPGESEKDFNELEEFVKDMKFDRLGVFAYSKEEGTPAALLKDQVEDTIKKERQEKIMNIQKEIAFQKNMEKIGKVYDILIEEKVDQENVYVGRTAYDAPEVDGVVYVHTNKRINIGSFVNVKITDNFEYDLLGEIADESCK